MIGACGDESGGGGAAPNTPDATSTTDASSDAPTATDQQAPSQEGSTLDPSRHFKSPTRVRYTQRPYAAAGCLMYSSVAADLVAKNMTVDTCADAGGATDAGTTQRMVTLSPADVAALVSLVEALREDTSAADAGCSGFDGTSHELLLAVPGNDSLDVRHEYVCSGTRPDIRIESAGFVALREKLHLLAGLDTAFPF